MRRAAFLPPAIAFLFTSPARAMGRKHAMALETILLQSHTVHLKTASVAIRHVGAYVSLRTALTPEQLAASAPIANLLDKARIDELFDTIRAAEPSATTESSEQRWSLTFHDAAGATLLVVTSSIFSPRHGTIGERRVSFANDRLVAFLAKNFAPDEEGASARR